MPLPMLYETSFVLPDVEGDPKRTKILEEQYYAADDDGASRWVRAYQYVIEHNPTALDVQIRLVRPHEVKKLTHVSAEQRLSRWILDTTFKHMRILAAMERNKEEIDKRLVA